jgi:nucleotide-binding universal stress UspA family protein
MTGEQNLTPVPGGGPPRIVVGVHGTAASDAAVDWAAREARLRGARLHLVLVRDRAAIRRPGYAQLVASAACDADPGSQTGLSRAAVLAAGVLAAELITSEVTDGLPSRVLADRAADASLLVLGAARAADFIGPVARACLRQAPCPVVVVAVGRSMRPGHDRRPLLTKSP